ncbi:MAG: GIY-YIG nuclease family protein [Methanosarcina sp.]
MNVNSYFVYILTNTYNSVLYVGVSNDIERRVFEHKSKSNKGFTSKYNVYKLVYLEEFELIESAISREKQIKKYSRFKKTELIERANPNWNELQVNGNILNHKI